MVQLKMQRRLASSVLKCGRNRVWLDPEEAAKVGDASTRVHIRSLINNGLIRKKNVEIHSRSRANARMLEKRKGRHMGIGKRRGTKNARMPEKILWIRKIRTLRRLLKKYRAHGKIDSSLYKELYLLSKGNMFKNKKVLIEEVIKRKQEGIREEKLNQQQQERRDKNLDKRQKKKEKKLAVLNA
jgi:large subunit ribosomal protein L19e